MESLVPSYIRCGMSDQNEKLVAAGKVLLGSARVLSGVALLCGKGLLGSFLHSHHLLKTGIPLARKSIDKGKDMVEDGWEKLTR